MSENDSRDEMIARIAAAYASRQDVSADDIITLVGRLSQELPGGGTATPRVVSPPSAQAEPAIPVDQAMTRDKVYCLCCGKGFKMLKRHLGAEHGLTESEYRAMFSLPEDVPLVAPSYSRKKAAYAKEAGLGKYNRGDSGRRTKVS